MYHIFRTDQTVVILPHVVTAGACDTQGSGSSLSVKLVAPSFLTPIRGDILSVI